MTSGMRRQDAASGELVDRFFTFPAIVILAVLVFALSIGITWSRPVHRPALRPVVQVPESPYVVPAGDPRQTVPPRTAPATH